MTGMHHTRPLTPSQRLVLTCSKSLNMGKEGPVKALVLNDEGASWKSILGPRLLELRLPLSLGASYLGDTWGH